MILCHCTGTTDRTIERLIEAGATTLSAIVRETGAGRCCQSCREEICDMLYRASVPTHTPSPVRVEAEAAGAA
jgi:bacterioferritin-associated ferredoxin